MLVDLPVNGETRKAVVTAGKLGIIEALDRTNGQWLWHKETVPQNVVASIDPKTGEKTINPAAIPHIGQTTVNCPADHGDGLLAAGCSQVFSGMPDLAAYLCGVQCE